LGWILGFQGTFIISLVVKLQWSTLEHVVSAGFDEGGEFFTVRDEIITFEDRPMLIHLQRFKAFSFYYCSKICLGETPTENDVMCWMT
jgi:hypothetical protein